jgi:hypothetical protein
VFFDFELEFNGFLIDSRMKRKFKAVKIVEIDSKRLELE